MSEARKDIDWSLTTWEGSRRAQLRRALELTLRERLEAVEGLADVVRRFEEMRLKGQFTSASGDAVRTQAAPGVHEPSPPYDADK
jgi:CRISPR-associated protein Csx17